MFNTLSKNSKNLFLLGLYFGLLQLPFSYYLLRFNFSIYAEPYRVLLFNFSLFFTGIGAFAFQLKKEQTEPSFIFPVLAFSPILFYFLSNFIFAVFGNKVHIVAIILFLIFWFFLQGYFVCSSLSRENNKQIGWSVHLFGLLIGIVFTHNMIFLTGPLVLYLLAALFYYFRKKISLTLGSLTILFLLFHFFPLNISHYSYFSDKFMDKLTQGYRLIDLRWGPTGQTLFLETPLKDQIAVMHNKRIVFLVNKSLETTRDNGYEIGRDILYKELLPFSNNTVIVGAGGLNSLMPLPSELISKKIHAVEINKAMTEFFSTNNESPVKNLAGNIDYVQEDGRFYLEKAEDQSIDNVVYESSYHHPLSENRFLWGFTLFNHDALTNISQKLKSDGVFVLEQRTRENKGENSTVYAEVSYINWQVQKKLQSLGFSVHTFQTPLIHSVQTFYLLASKSQNRLNPVLVKFNSLFPPLKIPDHFHESDCQEQFNDNYPFIDNSCLKKKQHGTSTWMSIIAGVLIALLFIILILNYKIFESKKWQLKGSFFMLGFLQYALYEFFFHRYLFFLYESDYTFVRIFCYSLIACAGATFLYQKKFLKKYFSFIVFFALIILVALKTQSSSTLTRELFLFSHVGITFLAFGLIFPELLTETSSTNMGQYFFLDSAGFLAAHLMSYFFSVTIGIKGYLYFSVMGLAYFSLRRCFKAFIDVVERFNLSL